MNKQHYTLGISTHNNLNYLKLCVDSVLKNSFYKDQPILIYAEGCTDGTNEWLESSEIFDNKQITTIIKPERWNDKYWGIGGGLNLLAENCKTEYFLPLHSDMYVGHHFDYELVK